jgi:hypothetical protein
MATSEKHDVRIGTESDASGSSIKDINEKALLRKLDYRLLPPLTLLYLLSFLDRSNVGNARLEGMTTDIKMCMFCVFKCFYIDPRANREIYSRKPVPYRSDSVLYRLCSF